MSFLLRFSFLLFIFVLSYPGEVKSFSQRLVKGNPSLYVSQELWKDIQDYLIPDDHPAKEKLDQIFSTSRALADKKSMVAAGFDFARPQRVTQIIVTRHPEMPGYIIKAYLDSTKYGHKGKPDYLFLIQRIVGARLAQERIHTHHYEHLLKVPEKWLYLLPDEPSPPSHYLRKLFILVEDDMNIVSARKNEKLWKSQHVTPELLDAFYTITTEVGLADSLRPDNCPFSKDGRVAFIDTQVFNVKPVKYHNLTPFLSAPMQAYWKELIKMRKSSVNCFHINHPQLD
jgi:hypothetical protein